ncbi:MAG: OmpA family protein [Acidobacteriota bacterium]|nr:OmpA family protein [Acidobacteriota bacterium]
MNHFKLIRTALVACLLLLTACAARGPYETRRDKTYTGAAIGAGVGALFSVLDGKTEADEILARAAIGAVAGAGVGAYMDAQEEKLARIPGTSVERVDGNTLLVRFDSDVLFAVNSHELNSKSRETLANAAGVIQEYKKTAVVVQGHTDSDGTEEYNQKLSERRADSVEVFFLRQGIPANRMTAMGYGERVPVASNDTAAGRAQNRRVTIMLRAKAK